MKSSRKKKGKISEYQKKFQTIFTALNPDNVLLYRDQFSEAYQALCIELNGIYNLNAASQTKKIKKIQAVISYLNSIKTKLDAFPVENDSIKSEHIRMFRGLSIAYQALYKTYLINQTRQAVSPEAKRTLLLEEANSAKIKADQYLDQAIARANLIDDSQVRAENLAFLQLDKCDLLRNSLVNVAEADGRQKVILKCSVSYFSKALHNRLAAFSDDLQERVGQSALSLFKACYDNYKTHYFLNAIMSVPQEVASQEWYQNGRAAIIPPVKFLDPVEIEVDSQQKMENFLESTINGARFLQKIVDNVMNEGVKEASELIQALETIERIVVNLSACMESFSQLNDLLNKKHSLQAQYYLLDQYQFGLGELRRCFGSVLLARFMLMSVEQQRASCDLLDRAISFFDLARCDYNQTQFGTLNQKGFLCLGKARALIRSHKTVEEKLKALTEYQQGVQFLSTYNLMVGVPERVGSYHSDLENKDVLIEELRRVFQDAAPEELKTFYQEVLDISGISSQLFYSIQASNKNFEQFLKQAEEAMPTDCRQKNQESLQPSIASHDKESAVSFLRSLLARFDKLHKTLLDINDCTEELGQCSDYLVLVDKILTIVSQSEDVMHDEKMVVLQSVLANTVGFRTQVSAQDNLKDSHKQIIIKTALLECLANQLVMRFQAVEEGESSQLRPVYNRAKESAMTADRFATTLEEKEIRDDLGFRVQLEKADLFRARLLIEEAVNCKSTYLQEALDEFKKVLKLLNQVVDRKVQEHICLSLTHFYECFSGFGCLYRFIAEFRSMFEDRSLPAWFLTELCAYFPCCQIMSFSFDNRKPQISIAKLIESLSHQGNELLTSMESVFYGDDAETKIQTLASFADDVSKVLSCVDEHKSYVVTFQSETAIEGEADFLSQRGLLLRMIANIYVYQCLLFQLNEHLLPGGYQSISSKDLSCALEKNDQAAQCFEQANDLSSLCKLCFKQARISIDLSESEEVCLKALDYYLRGMSVYSRLPESVQQNEFAGEFLREQYKLLRSLYEKFHQTHRADIEGLFDELKKNQSIPHIIKQYVESKDKERAAKKTDVVGGQGDEVNLEAVNNSLETLKGFVRAECKQTIAIDFVIVLLNVLEAEMVKFAKGVKLKNYQANLDALEDYFATLSCFVFYVTEGKEYSDEAKQAVREVYRRIQEGCLDILSNKLHFPQPQPYLTVANQQALQTGVAHKKNMVTSAVLGRYAYDAFIIQLSLDILSMLQSKNAVIKNEFLLRLDDLLADVAESIACVKNSHTSNIKSLNGAFMVTNQLRISFERIKIEEELSLFELNKGIYSLPKAKKNFVLDLCSEALKLHNVCLDIMDVGSDLFEDDELLLHVYSKGLERSKLLLITKKVSGASFVQSDKAGLNELFLIFRHSLVNLLGYIDRQKSTEFSAVHRFCFIQQKRVLSEILTVYQEVFPREKLQGLLEIRDGNCSVSEGLKPIQEFLPPFFTQFVKEEVDKLSRTVDNMPKKKKKKKKKKTRLPEQAEHSEKNESIAHVVEMVSMRQMCEETDEEGSGEESADDIGNDQLTETSSDEGVEQSPEMYSSEAIIIRGLEAKAKEAEEVCSDIQWVVERMKSKTDCWETSYGAFEDCICGLIDDCLSLNAQNQRLLIPEFYNEEWLEELTEILGVLPWEKIQKIVEEYDDEHMGEEEETIFNIILEKCFMLLEPKIDALLFSCQIEAYIFRIYGQSGVNDYRSGEYKKNDEARFEKAKSELKKLFEKEVYDRSLRWLSRILSHEGDAGELNRGLIMLIQGIQKTSAGASNSFKHLVGFYDTRNGQVVSVDKVPERVMLQSRRKGRKGRFKC